MTKNFFSKKEYKLTNTSSLPDYKRTFKEARSTHRNYSMKAISIHQVKKHSGRFFFTKQPKFRIQLSLCAIFHKQSFDDDDRKQTLVLDDPITNLKNKFITCIEKSRWKIEYGFIESLKSLKI